jgi:hypothetical protein
MKKIISINSFFMFVIIMSAHCQPRGPIVISPEINQDKTVIFRYLAPRAKEVKLSVPLSRTSIHIVLMSTA